MIASRSSRSSDREIKRTWRDVEGIAADLVKRYPQIDPLTLKFSELRLMVVGLPTFSDDPNAFTDPVLEEIQMAWYDEYEEEGGSAGS